MPLRAFKDTSKCYPLWLWNFRGRLQWYLNHTRQAESKEETRKRAQRTIDFSEEKNEDCYVVAHAFYLLNSLVKELKKRGYTVKKSRSLGIANLERIITTKESKY